MGRRILNRKDMRADFDAAERRKEDEDREEDEEEGDEEEDGEEGDEEEGEEAASDDDGDEDEDGGGGDDDEEAPKKKKKKPKVVKEVKPKRTRTPKVVRMRVLWGVFNNSNQMVKAFDYPRRADADAHAAQLMADKKSTHFVQPVKEPIEEKKEK